MDALHAPGFTLRQLSFLVAAADAGTVAGAATALHVTPSSVSDGITELERALDMRLTVRRRARGLTLTSAGADVVARARVLLTDAREVGASLAAAPGELAGPIVVGCYPTLVPTILPPVLRGFAAQHPRVALTIVEGTHDQLEGPLANGRVDVAFLYDTLVPAATHRRTLFARPAHVVLPADHPLAQADGVRLADLVDEDLILLDAPPSSEHTLSLFRAAGLAPRVRHRVRSAEAVRALVAHGLGYGVLVQRLEPGAGTVGGPLVQQEIVPPVAPVGIDVVWPASPAPTARTSALVDFACSLDWRAPAGPPSRRA